MHPTMASRSHDRNDPGRSVGEGDLFSHEDDSSLCGASLTTMTEIEIPSHLSHLVTDGFCPRGGHGYVYDFQLNLC